MRFPCDSKMRRSFLWRSDTSNTPFEWSDLHQFSDKPPQAPRLPLKGSVRRIGLVSLRTLDF